MIAAALTPAYLPRLEFFHRIACSDVCVLLDEEPYHPQSPESRGRIKTQAGTVWLAVPVVQGARDARICDRRISTAPDHDEWRRRTLLALKHNYGRAPHFARYVEELEEVYARPWERLVDLEVHLIRLLLRWLGIARPLLLSSTLRHAELRAEEPERRRPGDQSERVVELCRGLRADAWLAGPRDALDATRLHAAGVEPMEHEFIHPLHTQRHPSVGFIADLSAVDLLFNCGPDSHAILMRRAPAPPASIRDPEAAAKTPAPLA